MRHIKTLSILLTAFFLFSGCKKNNDNSSGSTPEGLLTKSPWRINELRFSQVNTSGGGTIYYYKRGTTGNLSDFDNHSILFNSNNTGTFTYGLTTSAPFTWQFTNAEKTKIQWIITYSPTNILTVNWENVTITDSEIRLSEYWTNTGITSVGFGNYLH
jgi:hypothetical protein